MQICNIKLTHSSNSYSITIPELYIYIYIYIYAKVCMFNIHSNKLKK